jgi:hypothetical protein
MLLALLAGAAIAVVAVLVVGNPFAKDPVTRTEIEQRVSKLPKGKVQLTLCNEIVVPTASGKPPPGQTWTCDTYIGPTKAAAQNNGPSYRVRVEGGEITSIRRVPTH